MRVCFRNLTIRNALPADAEILADWWNDGSVMIHSGYPNGMQITPEQIARSLESDSDGTFRRMIVQVGSLPVGEMDYKILEDQPYTAEIGIKICDVSARSQGYGKLFLSLLIEYLFVALGMHRIVLSTNINNTRARHIYERLGFECRRIRPNCWRDQLGNLQTAADYELLPQDFNSQIPRDGYYDA